MTSRENQLIDAMKRAITVPDIWDDPKEHATVMKGILIRALFELAPKEGADTE